MVLQDDQVPDEEIVFDDSEDESRNSDTQFDVLLGFEAGSDNKEVNNREIGISTKKSEREKLTRKEYEALATQAKAGIPQAFKMMSISESGIQELQGMYDVGLQVENLRDQLKQQDMIDVFTVVSKFTRNRKGFKTASPKAPTYDLLRQYNEVTLEVVKENSEFYWLKGKKYHIENLKWSKEKILNSCEQDLKLKVIEQLVKLEDRFQTGPVAFVLAMRKIMTSTEVSRRAVIIRLEQLRLKQIDGENVSKVASWIRGATLYLRNNRAEPTDIV